MLWRILGPTRRNVKQTTLYFLIAVISLVLSLGGGTKLLGHMYDYNSPLDSPDNGKMSSGSQLVGLFFLIYFGTLSIMMFVNFLPSLVVLDWQRSSLNFILVLFTIASILASLLCFFLLAQPQNTYANSLDGGKVDPAPAAVGLFFFFGFGFISVLCIGMVFAVNPELLKRLPKCLTIRQTILGMPRKVLAFLVTLLLLG